MNNDIRKEAHSAQVDSPLALGNCAMRAGDYAAAITYYLCAQQAMPAALSKIISSNLLMARYKYHAANEVNKQLNENLVDVLKTPYKWFVRPCVELIGKEVCIYTAYEPSGCLADYKRSYLDAIKKEGFFIVLVIILDDIEIDVSINGLEFVDGVLIRSNQGFDFAAWAAVIGLMPSIWNTNLLLLANDSVFGPSNSFGKVILNIRESDSDVVGLTESLEYDTHLQSYFLVFKTKALGSKLFRTYWEEIKNLRKKSDVIQSYEIKFTLFCKCIGLKCVALFPYESDSSDYSQKVNNPLHYQWRSLIKRGFPFVKVELLRDNPAQVDIVNWKIFLKTHGFNDEQIEHKILQENSK